MINGDDKGMKAILPIRRCSLWPLLVLIFIKAEPNSYCGTRVFAWGINTAPGVPLDLTNATAVAAGAHHNLALRNDSTVMAWGDNTSGQTNVPIGLSNVAAIAAGGLAGVGGTGHSLALRSNGTVVAWGDDSHGQCQLPAGLTNVVAIAAGAFHSLALKADGRIAAWGNNKIGRASCRKREVLSGGV